jgi:hypothetical protein
MQEFALTPLKSGCSELRWSLRHRLWWLSVWLQLKASVFDEQREHRNEHGVINACKPQSDRLRKYIPLLTRELSIYPVALLRKFNLKSIVLCEELSFNDEKRSAVPDFRQGALFLDVSQGHYCPNYLRKVVHHDLFHLIDFADDGLIYDDPVWAGLNDQSFRYGEGGSQMQADESSSLMTWEANGFITKYAQSALEEDKAELFSHMIVHYQAVLVKCAVDRVLRAKLFHMKEDLRQFSPAFNSAFWQKMDDRSVSPD